MRPIAAFLNTVLFAVAGAEAKPLKVFILAGQSNMEGPANVNTFEYDAAQSYELAGFAWLQGFNDMVDGHVYLKKLEADLISPAEAAVWKRGASNAGYHYLGCAKTFALMGKHFAEATLAMMKQKKTKP